MTWTSDDVNQLTTTRKPLRSHRPDSIVTESCCCCWSLHSLFCRVVGTTRKYVGSVCVRQSVNNSGKPLWSQGTDRQVGRYRQQLSLYNCSGTVEQERHFDSLLLQTKSITVGWNRSWNDALNIFYQSHTHTRARAHAHAHASRICSEEKKCRLDPFHCFVSSRDKTVTTCFVLCSQIYRRS